MARVSATSFRHMRCKTVGATPYWRRPLGVRYPHGGGGLAEYSPWGGADYSRRSFLDGQDGAYTLLDDNTASSGRRPGAGEPRFTVPPARSANARQILVTQNSKRDVLEWKHTHTWNFMGGPGNANVYQIIDQPWWRFMLDAGIDHPTIAGTNGEYSPVPLSDTAYFARGVNRFYQLGSEAGECIEVINVYSEPGDLGPTISWTTEELEPYQFRIKRTCRRYIYYENCLATIVDNAPSFALGTIRHVLREIDPRRVNSPFWDQGGTQPPAPDPKYLRNFNDCRFLPFGVTDALKRWAPLDSGGNPYDPNPTHPDTILANALGEAYYEQSVETGDGSATVPPVFYDEYAAQDNTFLSTDVGQISAKRVFDGMIYMAQPWARTAACNDGHNRLVPERSFDLLIAADFYHYKLRYFRDSTGGLIDAESGFGGVYGTCYAIY